MNVSFSLSSKPSSKQQTNLKPSKIFNSDDQDPSIAAKKEYVTEFDPSKTLAESKNRVIPPIQNEWRPYKKMKNLDLPTRPSDRPDLGFEVESLSVAAAAADGGPHMSYGLNLRNSQSISNNEAKIFESDQPPPAVESVMLKKLKEDLKRLPDDPGLDEYADMPVEDFAAALLAGYGWSEGRGIGRNAKGDVKVVQYERRTANEGLGFFSDMPTNNNSYNKSSSVTNGSKNKEKEGQRNSRGVEEEEELGRFSVGKVVRIVGGRDVGLKGRVVEVLGGSDTVLLKLSRSEEEVEVRTSDVAELGSVEEERCLRKLKELKIQGGLKDEMGGSDGRSTKAHQRHKESKREKIEENRKEEKQSRDEGRSEKRGEETKRTTLVSWLTRHIRVRIISKELKGGKLYLKKGVVVDVVGPTTCDISMDDSRELIQGAEQNLLETVIPRRGGPVFVLYGKHKGAYGSLAERDMENETGVVRDADTHELLNVRLDQIAEYIGDPSEVGY